MSYLVETILIMMAFLYGGLLSEKFLWLFPIALVVFSVHYHFDNKQKKNRK